MHHVAGVTTLLDRLSHGLRTDPQLLAQFYYADEELNQVAAELDSLDGRKDPQRCTLLVNQFRSCQALLEGCYKVSPKPALLEGKQPQFSQPFFIGEVLQLSDRLCGPHVDLLEQVHVFPVLRTLELDAVLQSHSVNSNSKMTWVTVDQCTETIHVCPLYKSAESAAETACDSLEMGTEAAE
ncbi:hypothetical protein llap_16043 [Limosa lapponica baueri]|uniref:Uncharacterized protein n=1 Tax=Limosa lapponica baueri TaxID=1758121 RepID=A0A2I0TIR6_LIMLA|nr:hypothetical protein llap_16043 [Limosa lapponica baueri]